MPADPAAGRPIEIAERRVGAVLRFLVGAAIVSSWRCLKNLIKFFLGRKTCVNEKGLFLRQFVLHRTGLRPISKITSTGLKSEGAGSQAVMIMNAISFARFLGLTYVHTPFSLIQHAQRPMAEWVAAWESLFNLGAGEIACDAARHEAVNFCYNFNELDLCFRWRRRWDELADHFKGMIPEFRRKYYGNKSPRTTGHVTIAVHVRRGDASHDDPVYFTSNERILRTVMATKSILDLSGVGYQIRLFSQGAPADFGRLSLPEVEFLLDADAVWTMQELIEADILIMAKGFFSYYAALISDGIKIFERQKVSREDLLPSWKWLSVPFNDDWIPCHGDGSFDEAAFKRRLVLAIQGKAKPSSSPDSLDGGRSRT